MASWQVEVYAPDGSLRTLLTPLSPVDEVWWSLRGDGDCGEALIRGVGLDLRPRDIVAIRASDEDVPAPPYVYWGWVVAAPSALDPQVTETRLMGGSLRLRELVNTLPYLSGSGPLDVAVMARAAMMLDGFSAPSVPRLLLEEPYAFPTLGFSVGPRRPRSELLAESLDGLAALCPEFTVEGANYVYAGETFEPGDLVPAVTWGVRAEPAVPAAVLFFGRPVGLLELDEVDDALSLEWEPAVGETVVDRVRVLLFDEPSEAALEAHSDGSGQTAWWPVAIDVAAVLPTPGSRPPPLLWPPGLTYPPPAPIVPQYQAHKVVRLPALDYLTRAQWSGATTSTGASNVANAFDTNESSFASNTGMVFSLARDASQTTRALRVRYSSFVPVAARVIHYADRPPVLPELWQSVTGILPATDGQQRDAWLLAPRSWGITEAGRVRIEVTAATKPGQEPALEPGGLRVYTIEPLQPDFGGMLRVAESHMQLPAEVAGIATIPNRLVAPKPRVELTLADERQLNAEGSAYEYLLSREEGISTRVYLNQALSAEATSERAALRGRIEAAERRAITVATRRL